MVADVLAYPQGNAARILLGARRATPFALPMTPFQKPGSRPIPPRLVREAVPRKGDTVPARLTLQ
jgi:hypothetical protein